MNILHLQCSEISRSMKSEKNRLLTYIAWSNAYMNPKDLAKAGFYSTRYEDFVRCAFCNIEICRWEAGDNAMLEHQRWSNACPFVRFIDVGNIPLNPNEKVEIPRVSEDICGRFEIEIHHNSVRSEQNIDLNKLGITPNRSPAYPNYNNLEARLMSFKEWPLSIKQKPEELSDAGFFYTGKGDKTICFSCGGGLKDWMEADKPWEQHARWFTKCSYVLMVKGRDFVIEVSNRFPAVMTTVQGVELQETDVERPTVEAKATTDLQPQSSITSANTSEKKKKKDNDDRLCKICYTEELGVVFLPCGHIVACVKCALSLSTCAVCRQPFTATVRAFLS